MRAHWPLSFVSVMACTAGETRPSPLRARTHTTLDVELSAEPTVGAIVDANLGGEELARVAWGVRSIAEPDPLTSDTAMPIGSITKMMTAVATLRLVERGVLRLDETLSQLLDWSEPSHREITIRQLLQHTSGLQDITEQPWYWEHAYAALSATELLTRIREQPVEFPAGEQFAYSNAGYFLLGVILERVVGSDYNSIIHEEVARPAGLSRTSLCASDELDAATIHPRGYAFDGFEFAPMRPPHVSGQMAAGGLCATASDLTRFARALVEGDLLSADGRKLMFSRTILADGALADYGLGCEIGALAFQPQYYHDGTTPGFSAQLAMYPLQRLYIATLTNTNNSTARRVNEALARTVFGYDGPQGVDDQLGRLLEGRYRFTEGGVDVDVYARDNQLWLRSVGACCAFRLRPRPDTSAHTYDLPTAAVEFRLRDGRATEITVHQDMQTLRGMRLRR